MTALGERIKGLRAERVLQQRQLAGKAGLTPSMVSQIESGRLTPSLHTLGRIAVALGVPIAALFDGQPAGSIVVTRRKDYPVVSFEGSSERWAVLGAGLFQGKIRAVVSTLGPKEDAWPRARERRRPSRARGRRQRAAGRGRAPRVGESRDEAGPGALGHSGIAPSQGDRTWLTAK